MRIFRTLIFILILTLVIPSSSVFAADNDTVKVDLITNGDFEDRLNGWVATGNLAEWVTDANGEDGCVYITKHDNNGELIQEEVQFVKGETYTLTAKIKMDKAVAKANFILMYADANDYSIIGPNTTVTTDETTVSTTFTFNGYGDLGKETGGSARVTVRIGRDSSDTDGSYNYWLDDFHITTKRDRETVEKLTAIPERDANRDLYAESMEQYGFDDTKDHWADYHFDWLAKEQIVLGDGTGKCNPDRFVTRAEVVQMLMRIINVERKGSNIFDDVLKDAYYYDAVCSANDLGIIDPALKLNNKFMPENYATRQEVTSMAVNMLDVMGKLPAKIKNPKQVNDLTEVSGWAKDYVTKAIETGIMAGDNLGQFNPKSNMTFAEAAVVIKRVMNIVEPSVFYVDYEGGNDDNIGSDIYPFKTLQKAKTAVSLANDNMKRDIIVYIKSGVTKVDQPLMFTSEDSGTNGYEIIYTKYGDGDAVISGGIEVNNWEIYDADKNIYRAYVGGVQSRQFFVNGVRGIRARSKGTISNPTWDNGEIGYTTTDKFLLDFEHPSDLEFVFNFAWTNPRAGVDRIYEEGDRVVVAMDQPIWGVLRNRGNVTIDKAPTYYENAYELLDEGGEWYLNNHDGYIYYMPRFFEDINTAECVIPVLEQFASLKGKSLDERIENIRFEDLDFKYTTWMRPSSNYGHSDAQDNFLRYAEHLPLEFNTDFFPDSVFYIENAENIAFHKCTFSKLGTAVINMMRGVRNCNVVGNEFYDCSANGVHTGDISTGQFDGWADNPTPEEEMRNIDITNNYFHHMAIDYGSATMISQTFPIESDMNDNEIFDIPYSGIHIGWGWNPYHTATTGTQINGNYVHDVMTEQMDGGAIYFCTGSGGTKANPNMMARNYLKDQYQIFGIIYFDHGCTGWRATENVVDLSEVPLWGENHDTYPSWFMAYSDSIKNIWGDHNYTSTLDTSAIGDPSRVHMTDNVYVTDGNWPDEAKQIMEEAGVKAPYKNLFPDKLQELKAPEKAMISIDETKPMELAAITRKEKAYDLSQIKGYYESSDESIVKVDENGNMTGVSRGTADVTAYFVVDEIIISATTTVACDISVSDMDLIESGKDTKDIVEILKIGDSKKVDVKAVDFIGEEVEVDKVELIAEDPEIISVDPDGTVTGLSRGETKVIAKAEKDGIEVVNEITVQVLIHGTGEKVDMKGTSTADMLSSANSWAFTDTGKIKRNADALEFYTPGGYATYMGEKFGDELLEFDLMIEGSATGWPSLAVRAQEHGSYDSPTGGMYLVTFRKDIIEVQRFVEGKRMVIFGYIEGNTPVGGGPRVNDCVVYDKWARVQMGAINEENGVRIIVNVDGVNVIDYLDTDKDAIREPGYFQVWSRSGGTMHLNG